MPEPGVARADDHRLVERYQALLRVNDVIAQYSDLKELFRHIAECLRQIVSFEIVTIGLYDAETDSMRLTFLEAQIPTPIHIGLTIPRSIVPAEEVMRTQKPVFVWADDPDTPHKFHQQKMRENGARVSYHFPLTTSIRQLGVLVMGSLRDIRLDAEEVEFLQRVANQVAVAIENAQNYEQACQAQQRYRALLGVSDVIHACQDLDELFSKLAESLRQVVAFDAIGVALLEPDGQTLRLCLLETWIHQEVGAGLKVPLNAVPGGWVMEHQRPLRVRIKDNDPRFTVHNEALASSGLGVSYHLPLTTSLTRLGELAFAFEGDDVVLPASELQFMQRAADQVAVAIENALAYREITRLRDTLALEKLYLEDEIRSEKNFEEIIGQSSALKVALKQVETVAPSDATVLILGETGTGKELIARAIHQASRRKERTFVKLNCAAIPTGLLESELFGHEKGAFTGAIAQKIGRLELANGGSLFLDEVGDIPLELQPKLLRALQEREFERLGSTRTQKVDIRLIAATHRDLTKMIQDKEFRSDLYYRLNVFPITIPPLRDRADDIPRLTRYFASKYAKRMDKDIETIPATSMKALQQWHWPGNVRELENFIERAVILSNGSTLNAPIAELKSLSPASGGSDSTLEATEREHILKVLSETRGVLAGPQGAAARLGLKRTTLQHRIKKLGISRGQYS